MDKNHQYATVQILRLLTLIETCFNRNQYEQTPGTVPQQNIEHMKAGTNKNGIKQILKIQAQPKSLVEPAA